MRLAGLQAERDYLFGELLSRRLRSETARKLIRELDLLEARHTVRSTPPRVNRGQLHPALRRSRSSMGRDAIMAFTDKCKLNTVVFSARGRSAGFDRAEVACDLGHADAFSKVATRLRHGEAHNTALM